jgi:predicted AAA+ superfamily ATPase
MENHTDKIRQVVEEYWRKEIPPSIERKIALKTESDHINDIIGPRRAGKTYLMFSTIRALLEEGLEKEATIYVNFENRKLLPLTPDYFNDLIEVVHARRLLKKYETVYIFLDEVQRVREWEKYVRSIYDEFKGHIKIFVSGSTSRLTGSELSYLLTGRHLTTTVQPLSFGEFLLFKGFTLQPGYPVEEDIAVIKEYLREYIEFGGFPEAVLTGTRKEDLIQTLFTDIISRDIMPMAKRRGEVIEDMVYLLCSNSGRLASFSKLTRTLGSMGVKVSVPTFEKYFTTMKEAFLFFDLKVFSYKVRDQMQYPRKIYCIDTGFVNFAGFRFSEDRGRLMENLVAVELLRRASLKTTVGLFYWKDQQHREVDFVVRNGIKVRQLIQVTYAIDRMGVEKREVNALVKAGDELGCGDLLVITWEYDGEEVVMGGRIVYRPLWKWLLGRE